MTTAMDLLTALDEIPHLGGCTGECPVVVTTTGRGSRAGRVLYRHQSIHLPVERRRVAVRVCWVEYSDVRSDLFAITFERIDWASVDGVYVGDVSLHVGDVPDPSQGSTDVRRCARLMLAAADLRDELAHASRAGVAV